MARLTQLWPTALPGRQYNIVPAAPPGIVYFEVDDQPFTFTDSHWGADVTFQLAVWFKATAGTVYSRLYDDTAAAEVAASVVSTANVAYTQQVSATCTLVDSHVYRFQLGAEGGGNGFIKGLGVIEAY